MDDLAFAIAIVGVMACFATIACVGVWADTKQREQDR